MLSQIFVRSPLIDSTIRFDDDPIRANMAIVCICFDEKLMAERLNDRLIQSKYATAIGITDAVHPQDGGVCVLLALIWIIYPSSNIGIQLGVCQIHRLSCMPLMHQNQNV